MIPYQSLIEDIRFDDSSAFVRKIMSVMNLTDIQVEELHNKPKIVLTTNVLYDVMEFIRTSEKLMICGDYDCDGVTSTTIAVLLAKKCGVEVGYYIPNRIEEGYGASMETMQLAYDKGYRHVLMVDNGVKANDAIEYAKLKGMHVAIVDHHAYEVAPDVDVFVHPDILEPYGSTMCAAGLMCVIAETNNLCDDYIKALACVGTIGDVMPLWHKNREIVLDGIESLNRNRFLTLTSLIKGNGSSIDARMIAFQIVPKINAVGRMADMVNINTFVQYLCADNDKTILDYASKVEHVNAVRKQKGSILRDRALCDVDDSPINILSDESYHEGLLGIVANQVTSQTGKPTIVFQEFDSVYKGSARSGTVSLNALFSQVDASYFVAMGGHDFAYGMTVKKEYFSRFKKDVIDIVSTLESVKSQEPTILIDEPFTSQMFDELQAFEPFGAGFQLPLFAFEIPQNYKVYPIKSMGVRITFTNFWLKSAVMFGTNVSNLNLDDSKLLVGRLAKTVPYGLSFTIESIL